MMQNQSKSTLSFFHKYVIGYTQGSLARAFLSRDHLSIQSVLVTLLVLLSIVLEHRVFKTKQLRSVLVKLLVLKKCLDGLASVISAMFPF